MASLPGLNLNFEASDEVNTVELAAGSEWRVEVPIGSPLKVKLVKGTAEIFGTELAIGTEVVLVGQKTAVFSWHGCTLEYVGKDVSEYSSDETPMSVYANLHFALEGRRPDVKTVNADSPAGPSVLILGPQSSGKSSLCKILVSYANKNQRFPMLVNLNPSEGVFTPPGGLSVAPVSDILDVEEGWGASPVNGPAPLHPKQPLVHFYGLESPLTNVRYYKHVLSRLSVGVAARLANDSTVRASGTIIDTHSSVIERDPGHGIISNIVGDFAVSVIVVVGHERLFADMTKRFKEKPQITVLKVPKSGGCVERDPSYVRAVQSATIRDYFYGTPKQVLSPHTVTVDFANVTVYRIAEDSAVSNKSVLPIGDEEADAAKQSSDFLVKLEPSTILQNCVMAVLNADRNDPVSTLAQSEVLGFVHVVESDDTKRKLKILMPVPGRLPDRPFVIGDYRYHE